MDLISLANKYETKEFLIGDPSWFMHQVEGDTDKELLSFIASALSHGSRKQFIPKIQLILDASEGNVKHWLLTSSYNKLIPRDSKSFYRLYSNQTMNDFLNALRQMLEQYGSMRAFVESLHTNNALQVIKGITEWFSAHNSKGVIPKDTSSSCKRVCMFLRWMVRNDSPVDLGLWSDIIDKKTLIIPMDTHVVQEAMKLGLLKSAATSMSNALRLSDKLKEIFPDDPIKGDFALFGLGVDESNKK